MAKQLQSGDTRAVDRFSSILPPTRRTALSFAIAIALGMPGMVHAQAAPAAEGELEEIVVTGIRAGIQSAIATKQEAMSIVESISAEDIGKLPDTSIAESISRLPGLTSQRAEGRASAISLRGTDPGFTSALLNGREQATTGDNRNVEFDQYPSELISQVIVYKTPDSKLIGQGLAGTIDMRTVRPLDYGKQAVVLNLRGEMNDNYDLGADSDDTGFRASFSYIDQFMDGKLGLAIGYAHLDSPINTAGFGTYEPWNAAGSSGGAASCGGGSPANCTNNPGVAAGNYVTNGMKVRADMGSTERDGLMAAVQFAPNDFYTGVDRPVLVDDGPDQQRAQPRGQPRRLPGAVLRRRVPERHGVRLLQHHRSCRYDRRRHAEQRDAAGAQLPVHDRRRDHRDGLAQRVHAERRVVADGRHQLLERHA